ncbi:hypothetical protein MBLL_01400 (plasmid) [Methylobacterium bullatum]|uniref:Uncharacterized protein n=1 Tax=Methylobacterium bullatum TaxID=570505 RepID=A0A679JT61_9HYPH|nr:hypothetical protein MBLL_01400 [Methylobacterium bullatum]
MCPLDRVQMSALGVIAQGHLCKLGLDLRAWNLNRSGFPGGSTS